MDVLRTPEHRFLDLPDYPFAPRYVDVGPRTTGGSLRMHTVDEGPREGRTVLMLHGEPTWSYLYRHVIPPCVDAGLRAVAPDLVGFGKSDKPAAIGDHSYARHVAWVRALIEALDLRGVTLLCQDWGSLIGLRLVGEIPERFASVVLSNGMLPTGDRGVPGAFRVWQAFAVHSPWLPISAIVDFGSQRALSPKERWAYDAPFPDRRYKAGARAMPALVPTRPDDPASADNRAAWAVLEQWDKPFATAFTNGDPITRGAERAIKKKIPGAQKADHPTLKGGHFVQEDAPAELARVTIATVGASHGAAGSPE